MAPRKTGKINRTFFLAPEISGLIDARTGGQGTPAETVSFMLKTFDTIVRKAKPDLSIPEWAVVVESLREASESVDASMAQVPVWFHVEDMTECDDELCAMWGIDRGGLLHRLRQLDPVGNIAVYDIARLFWCSPDPAARPEEVLAGLIKKPLKLGPQGLC